MKSGILTFENVKFAYNEDAKAALQNFNLEVAPGEFIALVGPSGSGKSTILKLAMGLYKPDAGKVTLGACKLF